MMFAISSRPNLHMNLTLAALAIAGAAALSTPAFAAKQSTVVAACKRTPQCSIITGSDGSVNGCSPHACFTCSKGKCVKVPDRLVDKPKLGPKTTTGAEVVRANIAPVNFATPSNNHMRMGGRR